MIDSPTDVGFDNMTDSKEKGTSPKAVFKHMIVTLNSLDSSYHELHDNEILQVID